MRPACANSSTRAGASTRDWLPGPRSLAYLSHGKLGNVEIDNRMGEQRKSLWVSSAHEGSIWPIGFGPRASGARLVVSCGNPESPGLAGWDVATSALKWRGPGTSGAFGIALASTQQADVLVAVATEEGVGLFDGASGEARTESGSGREVMLGDGPMWGVAAASTSNGAMFFAGAGHDGVIYRWSAQTGSPLGNPLLGHTTSVKDIDVVGWAGRQIIVSGDEKNFVYRWDADTGERIGTPLRSGGERISAGFTPETAHYFASADYDGNVRVWDAASGLQVGNMIAAGGYPTGLALFESNDSLNIVVANDESAVVRRWDVGTGRHLGDLSSGYSVVGGVLPDGAVVVVVGTTDGSLRMISVR